MENQPKRVDQATVDKIVGSGIFIPPRPDVLIQIDQLAQQEDVDLREVTRLISTDVALSAAVFRLAASPVFGLRKKPGSLEQAIPVLGLKQTISIVRSEALRKAVSGLLYPDALARVWERFNQIGLLTAILADSLKIREFTAEQAFTAGIFCDCGVPLLMEKHKDYASALKKDKDAPWPDLAAEDTRFDTDHTVVGAMVAHYWKLPDFIVDAIRNHHEAEYAQPTDRRLIAALQMALHIHDHINRNFDKTWATSRDFVLNELDIGFHEEDEIIEEVVEQFRYAS